MGLAGIALDSHHRADSIVNLVAMVSVSLAGHLEPTPRQPADSRRSGFNASKVMWEFFMQHSREAK